MPWLFTAWATPSAEACSDLIVGKKASVDGSVMISYSADSHTLYGDLVHYPAKAWGKGLMLQIHEWDTGKPLGYIPQAAVTYNVVGNMNEHQVAITESTWGGRKELHDPRASWTTVASSTWLCSAPAQLAKRSAS